MDTVIPLTDLEQAINYWRNLRPAQGEEARLCAEAAALATPYAMMIMRAARPWAWTNWVRPPARPTMAGAPPCKHPEPGAVQRPSTSSLISLASAWAPRVLLASTRDSPLPSIR